MYIHTLQAQTLSALYIHAVLSQTCSDYFIPELFSKHLCKMLRQSLNHASYHQITKQHSTISAKEKFQFLLVIVKSSFYVSRYHRVQLIPGHVKQVQQRTHGFRFFKLLQFSNPKNAKANIHMLNQEEKASFVLSCPLLCSFTALSPHYIFPASHLTLNLVILGIHILE